MNDNCELTASESEQRNFYVKYCRCVRCTMWNINPFKRFLCGCCVGCLDSNRPSKTVLKNTIEL